MRAVGGGKETIKHILSLFSHLTHSLIGQIGVNQKENEIPALRRLLKMDYCKEALSESLLLADALHTNPQTAKAIILSHADYLLVVKGNQKDLFDDITRAFIYEEDLPGTNYQTTVVKHDTHTEEQLTRKRSITTTVITINDQKLCDYLYQQYRFEKIQTVGVLKRNGTRTSKDGTKTAIDETICFVTSRILSSSQVCKLLRNHWCIENNLHWVKDYVFLEDRQTLRNGNAPQIMSLMRSICISILNLLKFKSISDALHNFQKEKTIHYQFLKIAAII